ncbi:VOC family protein [Roseitranquillus sediminis]|uniref:VOC family protein n=1 Tax=Roseitranquillus sediminis TaxID=2809051 RepID=UPI001D0C8C0D|nr:VOC family protein [Roseitranquillus sediminis]MBM9594798.1 VOC family protein [Roseitranquillus sediminis]
MQPIPYLFFRGDCAEAMRFYARTFGAGEPEIMPFSAMPEEERARMPGVAPDAVMHAALKVGDGWLYASDDPSGETRPMDGSSIALSFPSESEARRAFNALADGGDVRMPFEPTFWSPGFGTLTDRHGTRWMIMADGPEG